MPNVGDLTVKIKGDAKSLESALDSASSKLKKTGDKMKGLGKKMSLGITAPIAGIGIGAIMTGAKFEKGMNRVAALTQATGSDFDAMKDKAKELGRTTAFSATQSAEAMGFLAMAGFKSNEIVGAMPSVLSLAAAAQMDLGDAADITSNIMTGFGMKVEDLGHINDVLVKGMTSANVDLTMLGESMKYVGPVAASAGMKFEETAAAVALLGNAGIQGSMAGTALRGAMTRLLVPSDDAALAMKQLGVVALDSQGNLKSMTDIVGQLEDSGMSTAQAMTIFGQRAGPAMLALVDQGSGALDEMTKSLEDSGGTAKRVADTQMEGMSGAITEMKSAFEGLMIAISEDILPILTKLIDKITPLLQKFVSAPKPIKLIVIGIAALAMVMGPILLIIGMLIPGITALTTVIGIMSAAFGALNLSMGIILLVVLGVAAAIAAIIIVWKNWDKIVATFLSVWDKFKEGMGWLGDTFKGLWDGAKTAVTDFFEVVKQTFATVSQAVFDIFDSKWGWLLPGGILFKAIKLIWDNWEDIWAAIEIIAIVAWEKISEAFVKYFGWMLPGGAIHTALTATKDKFAEIWDSVKAKFDTVTTAISDLWKNHFGWMRPDGAIHTALIKLKTKFSDIWTSVKNKFDTIAKFVFDIWDEHFAWMRPGGVLFTALDSLKTKWETIWKAIGDAVKGPINVVIGGVNRLLTGMNKLDFGWEPKKLRGKTIFPGFEFKPFNFAQIPKLASGGIVKSPTLAMIGERGPEAVVPLGRGGGMGTTININILGATYGMDDFERKVTQAVTDGVRRGGFSGILATS